MTRQEKAQDDLNNFKALYRRAMDRARAMTPAERAEARARADLPGSGTLSIREYHQAAGQILQSQIEGPTPVAPLLREAGVGQRHLDPLDTASLEAWPAVAVARAWVELPRVSGQRPEHPFLTLCGPAETGKTQAAVVAAAKWARTNAGPRATGAPRPMMLLSAARLGAMPGWELEPFVEEASHVRFLVLDDLGAETLSKPVCSALFALLDARWSNGRRTIISANLSPGALHQRLDWEGKEPPGGQLGRTWRRLAAHWVATVSRGKGVLAANGEPTPFPAFDAPRRQRSRGQHEP